MSDRMRVTVTGASGFVGAALFKYMHSSGRFEIRAPLRSGKNVNLPSVSTPSFEALGDDSWFDILNDQDVLVHLAGRAHVFGRSRKNALTEFQCVNVHGTLELAKIARDQGVKRFIFISSIGVNGSYTGTEPFTEHCLPRPEADYARSKCEAEQGLWELARNCEMEVVIIRPPLVYAADAPGNFRRLLRLVASGLPLPLGAISNRRSLVALENLVDFIALCIDHPAAANEVFLIADGRDVSTPEIIKYIAEGMDKAPRLFPLPGWLLRGGAKLIGMSNVYSQLCDSLTIDSNKARTLLDWKPVVEVEDALRHAGRGFIAKGVR